jgi:type IX secretion system PorP/SprF family membrane protein
MQNRLKDSTKYIHKLQLLFILTMLACTAAAQQPFTFTQYMENAVPYNPALSLNSEDAGSLNAVARKQWLGINGAPTTYLLNGTMKFPSIQGAGGFMLMDDQLAVEQTFELNLFFAKSVWISETQRLAVSINAGLRQYKTNFASLDPNDPVTRNDFNELRPNIGFGVVWYSDRYYIGISLPELTIRSLGVAGQQDAADFRSNLYLTAGFKAVLSEDFNLRPSILVSYAQGMPLATALSLMLEAKNSVGFGFSYRTTNEAAAILSYNLGQYHIGYSYQFGTASNTIGGFGYATHELLLQLRFGKEKK